jgi:hypothetical protein
VTFSQLIHAAMEAQGVGHSVPFAASLLQVTGVPLEEAHLISRAAEVYRKILERERRTRGSLEWVRP